MSDDKLKFEPLGEDLIEPLSKMLQNLGQTHGARWFHPHGFTSRDLRRLIELRNRDLHLVFMIGREVVGYGMLRGWDEGYDVPSLGIAVARERRGQGWGRGIMNILHREARSRGVRAIRLKTYPENTEALRLYRDLGYRFTGLDDGQLVGWYEWPVYVSTAALKGTSSLEQRLEEFKGARLLSVELGAGVSVDSNLERDCEGLAVLVHNYFPPPLRPFFINLASPSDAIRERSIEFALGALELCARIGSPAYTIHSGFVTDPEPGQDGRLVFPSPRSPEAGRSALDRMIESCERLSKRSHDLGIRLLVENNVCTPNNVGKLLLQTPGEISEFFKGSVGQRCGLLLDTGHLLVTARTFGFDPEEMIESARGNIKMLHLHTNDGSRDTHQPVKQDDWPSTLLGREGFEEASVVVEAQFEEIGSLRAHTEWVRTKIYGEQGVG